MELGCSDGKRRHSKCTSWTRRLHATLTHHYLGGTAWRHDLVDVQEGHGTTEHSGAVVDQNKETKNIDTAASRVC